MGVKAETATVWRGGGRRWLTKLAAERAEARSTIKRRCECERGDGNRYPDYICALHEDPARYQRMIRLLVAMFVLRMPPTPQGDRPDV